MSNRLDWARTLATGTYCGPMEHLKGKTAMLHLYPSGRVTAQFDDKRLGFWAYGWHEFRRSQWKVDKRNEDHS